MIELPLFYHDKHILFLITSRDARFAKKKKVFFLKFQVCCACF